jgi:hypothetical protein
VNPTYAGVYVFGRYQSAKQVGPSGEIITRSRAMPESSWRVTIRDHHEGYIDWDQFVANRQRLLQTAPMVKFCPARLEKAFACCRASFCAVIVDGAWVCTIPATMASIRSISVSGGTARHWRRGPA